MPRIGAAHPAKARRVGSLVAPIVRRQVLQLGTRRRAGSRIGDRCAGRRYREGIGHALTIWPGSRPARYQGQQARPVVRRCGRRRRRLDIPPRSAREALRPRYRSVLGPVFPASVPPRQRQASAPILRYGSPSARMSPLPAHGRQSESTTGNGRNYRRPGRRRLRPDLFQNAGAGYLTRIFHKTGRISLNPLIKLGLRQ